MKNVFKISCVLIIIILQAACMGQKNQNSGSGSEPGSNLQSGLITSSVSEDSKTSDSGSSSGSQGESGLSAVNPDSGTKSSTKGSSSVKSSSSSNSSSSVSVTMNSASGNGYNSNMVVAVDQFGRTFDSIASTKSSKKVGMFFWLWIGQPYSSGIYDATKIAAMPNGNKLLYDPASLNNSISPDGQAHFWGEPLWGYYNSADEWVIRKQIEMLTFAGVDFIVFDTTNAVIYKNVYTKVLRIIEEYQKEGFNPPKVAFYTHSRSTTTVTLLYNSLYKRNQYPSTWYRVNGKPMIIGYTNTILDKQEAQSRGDSSYDPQPLSKEITDFFYFKIPQWPGDFSYDNGFPWIEWTYPQPMHGDTMSVTVASHPSVPFSSSITRGAVNWGRGWDPATKKNISANVDKGTFFQQQWNTVFRTNPNTVFVGGWNEWIAYKQMYNGEYMLCDACSKEYSRDIEPMSGGYEDAFYIQLIQNIRKYKGVSSTVKADPAKTINVNSGVDQWSGVETIYRDVGKANYSRNEYSATVSLKYTQAAPRNNIQEVKVAHDSNNLYFLISCENTITAYDGKQNWMNIFLSAGNPSLRGWEGYDYAINRNPKNGKTSIEKLKSDFSGTSAGEAEYTISGRYMQVKVPKSALGITSGTNSFYFKVSDGVEKASDIMNTYTTGKSLPMGRLSYKYLLK